MGLFHIEISADGVHGCDRQAASGEKLHHACGRLGCPDCETRDFIQRLQSKGIFIKRAIFTHAPGSEGQVVDDLVRRTRVSGSF